MPCSVWRCYPGRGSFKSDITRRGCSPGKRISWSAYGTHCECFGGRIISNATCAGFKRPKFYAGCHLGGTAIRLLRHLKIGKIIRVEEPGVNIVKMGTPTMGGVMVFAPVVLLTVLLNIVTILGQHLAGRSILLPMVVIIGYALLGGLDDWEGIHGPRRGLGMRVRTKFIFQIVLALATAITLKYFLKPPEMYWPGIDRVINLGIWYIPVATFIIVGATNAV